MPPSILDLIERDAGAGAAHAFADLAADYLAATRDRSGRVSTPLGPAELARRFDEPLPRAPRPLDEVIARLRDDVIPDCNHLYHPRYIGHQVSAPLPAAIWSESLIAALNQSVAVFEMSPVVTVIEHQMMRWMTALVGFGAGAGGTLTTGGTEATFTALLAARAAALPDAWMDGVAQTTGRGAPLVLCGEHAHYAVTRAVGQLGLGMRNVQLVPAVPHEYRMDPRALERALADARRDERVVVAVIATAGSTATGSFDDLEAIGALCDAHDVWLHVDGAHGASAILSAQHRHRLHGIERARSIAWDPHKMMLLPLQAGMVLVRHERDLESAFSQRAPYLFHGAEDERVVDQGVRSFLCSRRADVLKLWVALQRYGSDGIAAAYDHLCGVAEAMYEMMDAHDDFEAIHEPESNILCFRYAPRAARSGMSPEELDALNRDVRERYNRSGHGWITTTMLGGRRVLRATIMNVRTTVDDVREVLETVARC